MGRKSREKKERRMMQGKVLKSIETEKTNIIQDTKPVKPSVTDVSENFSYPLDESDLRVIVILGVNNEDEIEVNRKNIKTYWHYLKDKLELPCIVTGREDMGCFSWEERFNWGMGSKKEWEKLKKMYPSYTDQYELLDLSEMDIEDGILVDVKRLSDKKKFTLPLRDLETVNEKSTHFQLIDDYACWFVNNRQ